jgi:MFS family permease
MTSVGPGAIGPGLGARAVAVYDLPLCRSKLLADFPRVGTARGAIWIPMLSWSVLERENPAARWLALAALAAGEFLGMTLWFSATAATPSLMREFHLSGSGAAWLTMGVQGGFVAGTLVSAVLNLPDVINARRLFALGCALGALVNLGVTWAPGGATVIALRFVTGASLAFVYPTGMKIAASWFDRQRGTALGILIGALTLGKSFPHLLAWLTAGRTWHTGMHVVSALALSGGLIVLVVVRDGPHLAATSRFDPHAASRVWRERRLRLATLGYFGHMWELYAMWAWIGVFAAASLEAAGGQRSTGSVAAFIGIAAGAAGCIVARLVADRVGKARVAGWAMMASALAGVAAGIVFGLPRPVLYALVAIWGFTVVADSAQFSALVSEYSPRAHVGTALTVQTCGGFLLTMLSIWLVPALAAVIGWRWVFLVLVPGPVPGTWAMARLRKGG